MKVLKGHTTFQTPAFNSQTPAQHILAFSPSQATVYSRYANEVRIETLNDSPETLLRDKASSIVSTITPNSLQPSKGLYFGTKATLVPSSYFSNNNSKELIAGVFDVLPHETLLSYAIEPNLVQLFAVPTWILGLTENKLGRCTWAHSAGVMLPSYQHEATQHAHDTVFLYIVDGIAAFTLYSNNQLQKQHLQTFSHPNDLLYTLLHLNAHLSNPQEPRALFIHGEWDGLPDFMSMLQSKNWPVNPFKHPNASLFPSLPNTAFVPLHQVYSLCAL